MNPEVSVIMPVFNAEKYLKEAISSILEQSFTNFEFIIINDGSTDSSLQVIRNFQDSRIMVIDQKNKGVAIALNDGIKKSGSNFIARMDADDFSEKFRLATQVEYLNKNPNTTMIGSNAIVVDMSGKYIYTSNVPLEWDEIKAGIPIFSIYHSSVMFRKNDVVKAGLYDERISRLNAFEDQLLWNKLTNYGIIENIKEPLIRYRLQPDAVTSKSFAEGILAKKIIPELVAGRFPEKEINELLEVKRAMKKRDRYYNYHTYIAKKYLFESRKRVSALKSILKALILKPFGFTAILYMACLLFPLSFIRKIKPGNS